MAALDAAPEIPANGGQRDLAQRAGASLAAFIDMQVEVEAARLGQREEVVEHGLEVVRQRGMQAAGQPGHHAQHTTMRSDQIRHLVALGATEAVERRDRDHLQRHAPCPFVAQLREYRPGGAGQRQVAVQMRADGNGAVRERATQGKIGPRVNVLGGPGRTPVGHDRLDGAGEIAGQVRRAGPDVSLVEMGVAIDHAGPDLAAIEIDAAGRRAQRCHGGDGAVRDMDIHPRQGALPHHAGIVQPVLRPRRPNGLSHRLSPAPALSCQRRSSRCDIRLSARKMRMSVAETSTRAANISGICS